MNQEQIIQIQLLEQESQQMNQQLNLIEENVKELNELNASFSELEKEPKELLVNIGKRIFLPVSLNKGKLIVEVGNKNFVEKSIPDARKIVEDQLKKLIVVKTEVEDKLNDLQSEAERLISLLDQEEKKETK